MIIEQHRAILNIIDIGANLIHSVGRFDGNDIILARITETTIWQVNSLVASISKEDTILWHTLNLRQLSLQLQLQRIRIAVEGGVIGVLVGIEEYTCLSAGILVPGAAIRCQIPYILPAKLFKLNHNLTFCLFSPVSPSSHSYVHPTARLLP